jgi:hypothetical protein
MAKTKAEREAAIEIKGKTLLVERLKFYLASGKEYHPNLKARFEETITRLSAELGL